MQSLLLAYSAYKNSPTEDEPGHIASGLSHWRDGTFDAYRVNPPLVRLVATIPLLPFQPSLNYSGRLEETPFSRNEFVLGRMLMAENEPNIPRFVCIARLTCIPIVLLGGIVCYLWGAALYGQAAGVFSILLWTFCPNVLGYGCLVTPDVPAAATGVFAAYVFWLWSGQLSWRHCFLSGMALSLALLTKSTWIVLIPIWAIVGVIIAWRQAPVAQQFGRHVSPTTATSRTVITQVAGMFVIAIVIVNAGYGFRGSFQPIGHFRFISDTLSGSGADGQTGNVFDIPLIRRIPSPLPADYVQGMDVQKHDFEFRKPAYLNGQFQRGGWWYYYLIAFLIKSPAGYVFASVARLLDAIMDFAATSLALHRDKRPGRNMRQHHVPHDPQDGSERFVMSSSNLILLLPGLVVFALASYQTGINQGIRYVIPAFPFLYIWIGGLLRSDRPSASCSGIAPCRAEDVSADATATASQQATIPRRQDDKGLRSRSIRNSVAARVATACLVFGIAESLACYPLSLSFFNLFVGGPSAGSKYLIHSNVDWGQDHRRMQDWISANPQASPFHYLNFGLVDRIQLGIPIRGVGTTSSDELDSASLPAGWYAVSVNDVRRAHLSGNGVNSISWLASQEPVDTIGHSIWIYRVKPQR